MTHDSSYSPSLLAKDDLPLVVLESKSFVAFDEWMDSQLQHLVGQWIHTAAPNASRAEKRWQRFGG